MNLEHIIDRCRVPIPYFSPASLKSRGKREESEGGGGGDNYMQRSRGDL